MNPNSSKGKGKQSLNQMIENAFFAMHPYPILTFETDKYYNGIAKKLLPMLHPMRTLLRVPDQVIMRMALSVAAYLEDQCSHLGLWAAFTHRYHEMYGRWLPWYDTTSEDADYYDDEVNLQDVKFILWMILVSTEGTPVIDPEHEAIQKSAEKIFELLKDEYEVAPVNKSLVDFIYSDKLTDDFYSLKNILRWMTTTCYLMAVPAWQMEASQQIRNAISRVVGENPDPGIIPYFESSYQCVRMTFGPLALYPKDWFVLMRRFRGITKDNKDIEEIQSTPFYPFMVVSNDGDTVTLRSCRNIDYIVDTDSFGDGYGKIMSPGNLMITSLVRYKGHWLSNGITQLVQTNESTQKGEETLRKMGAQLKQNNLDIDLFNQPDYSVKVRVNETIVEKVKALLRENNEDRIFYFANGQSALEWHNMLAGRKIDNYELFKKSFDSDKPLMIYVSSDYLTMSMSMVGTVNDPQNPYYDASLAYRGIDWIYQKFGVLDEFVAYLVKQNFLANLSFNPYVPDEKDSKLIAENLPFFATFMRQYPC